MELWDSLGIFTIKAKHISIEILIIVNINNLFIHTSTIFINTYFKHIYPFNLQGKNLKYYSW